MEPPHWTSLEDNCFGLRSPVEGEPCHSRRKIGSLRSVPGRLLSLPTDKCLARCGRRPKPNRPESICSTNCYRSRPAMHLDDHRPRRLSARSHLRFWHDRICFRAVGTPLDHLRHQPRCPSAGAHATDCTASGFLDSGLTVFASTPPRPTRGGRVAPGPGFGSRTSPASTARCTSA